MIDDANYIPVDTTLETDVCIIGGGAAGISIALELAGGPCRVVLAEGGGKKETEAARDLYRGSVASGSSHEPLEEGRRRQWGGTTAAWGGTCLPFDAIDFEKREWVPHSGWPFPKTALDPFYERAQRLCEVGDYLYRTEEVFPEKQREMIAGFDGEEVVTDRLERWSPPTHFGRRYEKQLRASANVKVLLHANCTGLRLDAGSHLIRHAGFTSGAGGKFRIKARHYVVATGGLESARLLMASDDVLPEGLGNHAGKLGRFYMSHLFGVIAVARLRDRSRGFIYDFEKDAQGVYCRRRFWITPRAQREQKALNAIAYFFRPPLSDVRHHDALFSALFLAKFAAKVLRQGGGGRMAALLRQRKAVLWEHGKNVVRGAPLLVPQLARIARSRFLSRRRLPIVLPPKATEYHHLFYNTEHAPHPDSRLRLEEGERDALGMPRLIADIRFQEQDWETVLIAHRLIARQFEKSGTGELLYREEEVIARLQRDARDFNSSSHHLGTTRMSADPAEGVVNPDCRVHGVGNLFVSSGSVFPTGSHANPTLTVVALAVRLADHLKSLMG